MITSSKNRRKVFNQNDSLDPFEMGNYSDSELLELRISIDNELKKRGLKFSVGDLGETLIVNYFNTTPNLPKLQKAPPGVKNVDALSRDGQWYSIKTVQLAKKTGTIYPDEKNPNLQLFEFLILAQLDSSYSLKRVYRFSWDQFVKLRAWDKRMNAWYIPLSDIRLNLCENLYRKDE